MASGRPHAGGFRNAPPAQGRPAPHQQYAQQQHHQQQRQQHQPQYQQQGPTVQFASRPAPGSSLTERFSRIAEERARAATQMASKARGNPAPAHNLRHQQVPTGPRRSVPQSAPLRTANPLGPRKGAGVQRPTPRGGPRGAPAPAVSSRTRAAGGRGRPGQQRGAAGGAKKGGKPAPRKPASQSDLDKELDDYLMKDETTAKARLDTDMDSYMAEGPIDMDVNAPTVV